MIFASADAQVIVDGSTFTGNRGSAFDGYLNNSVIITNNMFTNNTHYSPITSSFDSSVLIKGNMFKGNSNYGGGGLTLYADLDFSVLNNTFTSNTANAGGAIYALFSNLTINNNIFDSNTTFSAESFYYNQGGAIFSKLSTLTLNNDIFNNNSSPGDGGAIYSSGAGRVDGFTAAVVVNNSTFNNNSATHKGGAIYAEKGLKLFTKIGTNLYISDSIYSYEY